MFIIWHDLDLNKNWSTKKKATERKICIKFVENGEKAVQESQSIFTSNHLIFPCVWLWTFCSSSSLPSSWFLPFTWEGLSRTQSKEQKILTVSVLVVHIPASNTVAWYPFRLWLSTLSTPSVRTMPTCYQKLPKEQTQKMGKDLNEDAVLTGEEHQRQLVIGTEERFPKRRYAGTFFMNVRNRL